MTARPGRYTCPLCDGHAERWSFYPAFGQPICDECDSALLDDETTFGTACRAFDLSPSLLLAIVERQRPLQLTAFEVDQRFGRD